MRILSLMSGGAEEVLFRGGTLIEVLGWEGTLGSSFLDRFSTGDSMMVGLAFRLKAFC